MKTDFLGAAYTSRSLPLACQTLVNLFFEPGAPGTPDGMFYDAPGRKLFATIGTGPIRGMRTVAGIGFVVSGGSLYRVLPDGNVAVIGAVPGTGRVHLSNNDTQLVVMHSVGWHVLDVASLTYTAVPNAPTTAQGHYNNARIWAPRGDGPFIWTEVGNATVIDPLSFASAEAMPDGVVATWGDHGENWFFGETTTQVGQPSENNDLPNTMTATLEHGCAAKHSPAKADNSMFWLGRDENGQGVVFRAEGYSPSRVSTYALEAAITGYTVEDAFGFCYQQGGHTFYVLTFPEATWAFDISTNRWTQLAWREPSTGELQRVRDNAYMFLAGKHLVGDHTSGKVYQLDLDTFTDDGALIHRERAWSVIENGGSWLRHNALQLMAEMGVGLTPGPEWGEYRTTVESTVGDKLVTTGRYDVGSGGPHVAQLSGSVWQVVSITRHVRNILTRTQEFDNAAWSKTRVVVTANAAQAPDETTTADKLAADTNNNSHFTDNTPAIAFGDNEVLSASVYVKPAGVDAVRLELVRKTGGSWSANVNIATGTVIGGTVTPVLTMLPNGWCRIAISGDVGVGATAPRLRVTLLNNSGAITHAGNGVDGIQLWGAQLERASVATEYQRVDAAVVGSPLGADRYFVMSPAPSSLVAGDVVTFGLAGTGEDIDPAARLVGSDPVVLLDWSDDPGRNWSNTRELRLGRIGEYRNRARTQRLGLSRARVYRLRSTDPVPHRWYGVNLDATAGRR